jgi:4-hydroxybenzoate polyprenyltransferase
MEFYKTNIRPWLGTLALLAIGFMMIYQPHAFDTVEPEGRKAFFKMIFKFIWGIPAGIIFLILSGFAANTQIQRIRTRGKEESQVHQ